MTIAPQFMISKADVEDRDISDDQRLMLSRLAESFGCLDQALIFETANGFIAHIPRKSSKPFKPDVSMRLTVQDLGYLNIIEGLRWFDATYGEVKIGFEL